MLKKLVCKLRNHIWTGTTYYEAEYLIGEWVCFRCGLRDDFRVKQEPFFSKQAIIFIGEPDDADTQPH